MIPEVQAEVQEGDFRGEAQELEAGAVRVGLGGAPDVFEVDGEGGLPPGQGEEVGVEVDVNAGWVAPGDFEGDVGKGGGGFETRPYGWSCTRPYGVAEVCKHSCDGRVVGGVDEDVDVTEGTQGWIGVEIGDEGPAFEDEEL